jgi:hypothetical protein
VNSEWRSCSLHIVLPTWPRQCSIYLLTSIVVWPIKLWHRCADDTPLLSLFLTTGKPILEMHASKEFPEIHIPEVEIRYLAYLQYCTLGSKTKAYGNVTYWNLRVSERNLILVKAYSYKNYFTYSRTL